MSERSISTVAELLTAVSDPHVRFITLVSTMTGVPTFRLLPGQALVGRDEHARLGFAEAADGIQLSSDNRVTNLDIVVDVDRRALFNDTSVEHLGALRLERLNLTGAVEIIAADAVRGGHIEAHDIDIRAADVRARTSRPQGYGVEVLAGAFTLWNQQPDPAVVITADLTALSAGCAGAPVRGGGVFVSGAGDQGGRLCVSRLETGSIHSDGGIAPGTRNIISGAVFVVHGAVVDAVTTRAAVTTYGCNDMVLDNWGAVDRWTVLDKITSYGPSGIGFVNFGTINRLRAKALIETFGQGARGFNVYTGTVHEAEFERVVTHADGAVGIQISQPVGDIVVHGGVETFGATGASLVKGVVVDLPATALSIKPGGSVKKLSISGGLRSHGAGIEALELHGQVESLRIRGGVTGGDGFAAI